MLQTNLAGNVSYAPDCIFCDLKIDDVATEEYKDYLSKTAKRGAWATDPRNDSGRIVVRCPICEIEFVSTVYALSDATVEQLKDAWIKEEFLAEAPRDGVFGH